MYHANSGLTVFGTVLVNGCNDPSECARSSQVVEILVPPYLSPTLSILSLQVNTKYKRTDQTYGSEYLANQYTEVAHGLSVGTKAPLQHLAAQHSRLTQLAVAKCASWPRARGGGGVGRLGAAVR